MADDLRKKTRARGESYLFYFPTAMAYLQDDPPLPPLAELFPYLEKESLRLPDRLDPFTVTTTNGFLPFKTPLTELPAEFAPLSAILRQMPIRKEDGTPGLLADYKLGPLIDGSAMPDLTAEVEALIDNQESLSLAVLTALFRDYSFLASAYLLEPCWESSIKDHTAGYGLGRGFLPKCIAGPMVRTAKA